MARYYSKVGTNEIIVDSRTRPVCPATYIEMMEDRPTPEHIAQEDGSWVIPLENTRSNALSELSHVFERAIFYAFTECSLGFSVNANDKALRNIEGLLLLSNGKDPIEFRTYDNQFVKLTKKDLEVIQKEIILHIQSLYQRKWALEALIQKATTVEEILKVASDFQNDERLRQEANLC